MTIRITKFGGIAPRVNPRNLARQMAVVAENVDLASGALQPWRKPRKVSDKTGEYLFKNCCTIVSPNCDATVVDMEINCGLMVSTRIKDWPAIANQDDACAGNWSRLGFPLVIPAPSANPTLPPRPFEVTDHSRQIRSYKIRLVNKFGHKSEPSRTSNMIEANSTVPVVVTVPTSFPAEYAITQIEIFGSEQSPDISGKTGLGGFFLVGTVNIGTATFTDNRDYLGDELDTDEYNTPPENLHQINYWQTGELCGLSGNQVVFSIRHNPHAWPYQFRHRLHNTPKAMVTGMGFGFVATDGRPAIIQPNGQCTMMGCHRVTEHDDSHPIASVRSMVLHNEHAFWATQDGLLMMSANRQTSLITQQFFTQSQWRAIKPETMIGAIHDGCYYGFTDTIVFRLRIPDNTYDKQSDIDLTTINLGSKPKSLYRSVRDELYILMADGVYWWNEGNEFLTMRWKSSALDTNGWTAYSAYKIEGEFDPAAIKHWCDNELVDTDIALNNRPMRLNTHTGQVWQFEIIGTGEVSKYTLAPSIRNLSLGQSA